MSTQPKRPVFLVGMMGSGKTTVGRLLATRLGVEFIDLDARIERMFGRSIAELFEDGEPSFRRMESSALTSLAHEPGFGQQATVVATGGGVVISADNRRWMAEHGMVVHLCVGLDTLCTRLAAADERGKRPLVTDGQQLRSTLAQLLADRKAGYEVGAMIVDGEAEPGRVVDEVLRTLSLGANEHDGGVHVG